MAARGVFRRRGSAKEQLPVGLRVFWGTRWKWAFPPGCPPTPTHPQPPGLCFASGLRSAVAAVSGHQVVFFALYVLATLTCRTSHAWQLNALSPSSHLENKAAANALWPDKNTHLTTYVSQNCSAAEKSRSV